MEVGQEFKTKAVMKLALGKFNISVPASTMVQKSNKTAFVVRCKDAVCNWIMRARCHQGCKWVVTRIEGEHHCMPRNGNHSAQNSVALVCDLIKDEVHANPSVTVKVLRCGLLKKYNIAYQIVKGALAEVRRSVRGDGTSNFELLEGYLDRVGVLSYTSLQHTNRTFKRAFMLIQQAAECFIHSPPVLAVDATHLKGDLGGQLALAVFSDSNNTSVILASAIFHTESTESWEWFLREMKHGLEVFGAMDDDLVIISDRDKGLL